VTGLGVLGLLADREKLIADTAREVKAQNTADLARRVAAVVSEVREAKSEIEALNAKLASSKLDAILASAVDVKGVKLVTARLDGMNINAARSLTDTIKSNADTVAVLAVVADGKLNFLACAGADAVKAGAHAGKLVGAVAAIASGKGGGRPDSAMAGATDVSAVEKALASAADILAGQIK
jgi:alanyl-tRNA synthetase